MEAIRFQAIVGPDQVIRPPTGISLPNGAIEVTVRPLRQPIAVETDPLAPTQDWLLKLVEEVEELTPDLPVDLALKHDHHAHGKPLSMPFINGI